MGLHGPTTYFASYALTGLIAFFFFLIPGVEFLQQILGGLITDLDDFITTLPSASIFNLSTLFKIVETAGETSAFFAYPLHWTLTYRPDDAWMIALQIIPWLASGAIIGGLFPDNPKEALIIGAGTILSSCASLVLLGMLLPAILLPSIPTAGPIIQGVLNGAATGLTDLPMGVSSVMTILEGGGIFTAMLLFMSTLKSNESPAPESERGATVALLFTGLLGGLLFIPGFILGLVNASKNPGDRKAIAATIIGAMELAIFVMILFVFVPSA